MTSTSKGLVVGFLFSEDYSEVVLIQKLKPDWQRGKLNGVGGKIEPGETPHAAMEREFREEAGLDWPWQLYAKLYRREKFDLYCFFSVGPTHKVKTMEAERVVTVATRSLLVNALTDEFQTLGNITWHVAMALAVARGKDSCKYFEIEEVG